MENNNNLYTVLGTRYTVVSVGGDGQMSEVTMRLTRHPERTIALTRVHTPNEHNRASAGARRE